MGEVTDLSTKFSTYKICDFIVEAKGNVVVDYGCSSRKFRADLSAKRPDLALFPVDSSIQSDLSKGSTGDYAEIGPALMSSVRLHSTANRSHYSEINDAVQMFSYSRPENGDTRNTEIEDAGNKQNLYNDPDSDDQVPSAPPETSSYSKLERLVPMIYVTSESGESEVENENETTCLPLAVDPYKTTTWKSGTGEDFSCSDADQAGESSAGSFSFPDQHPLPTIFEHPYHVLEQSGSVLDKEYQPPRALQNEDKSHNRNGILHSSSGYKNEHYEYDRLADLQLYSILDRSISNPGFSSLAVSNPGISRIYDIQNGPYGKLEPKASSEVQPKSKHIAELNMSADIFDDAQYVSPVPTPNIRGIETVPKEDKKACSKYYGDYERDPIYMKNVCCEKPTDLYQPLEVSAMDPVQDYEKPLPSPSSNVIMH